MPGARFPLDQTETSERSTRLVLDESQMIPCYCSLSPRFLSSHGAAARNFSLPVVESYVELWVKLCIEPVDDVELVETILDDRVWSSPVGV